MGKRVTRAFRERTREREQLRCATSCGWTLGLLACVREVHETCLAEEPSGLICAFRERFCSAVRTRPW